MSLGLRAADVSSGTAGTGLCLGACDGTKACTSVPLRWTRPKFFHARRKQRDMGTANLSRRLRRDRIPVPLSRCGGPDLTSPADKVGSRDSEFPNFRGSEISSPPAAAKSTAAGQGYRPKSRAAGRPRLAPVPAVPPLTSDARTQSRRLRPTKRTQSRRLCPPEEDAVPPLTSAGRGRRPAALLAPKLINP